jgi:hypothetical protein
LQLTFRYETDAFTDDASQCSQSSAAVVDVIFRTSISSAERQSLFLSSTGTSLFLAAPSRVH